jgi:tRNA(adenine34) deaminase
MTSDEHHMQLALAQARAAEAAGEVPVGAVLLHKGTVIAAAGNSPISDCDPTAHAEMSVLRAGATALGSYRLNDTTLYVTLEPCLMCAQALVHARVARVVYGAFDARAGAAGSLIDVFRLTGQNHRVDVFGGVLANECEQLLRRFFDARRAAGIGT